MARILIVEDDGLVARQMAQALLGVGHVPVLAPDARAALREAGTRPELILLDLGLPDLPGEALLGELRQVPETALAPVVVVTGKTENAESLRRASPPGLAEILLKPVANARLCQAVQTALRSPQSNSSPQPALAPAEFRRHELIRRLIVEGPDRLAFHVYRRICADRTVPQGQEAAEVLGWPEIAHWAKLEGLVDEVGAQLLRGELLPPASLGAEASPTQEA
jgi:DNA-binding response OmpR family regulator